MLSVFISGVAAYRHLPQLPAVLNNLADLHALFPQAVIVADPESPAGVLDPLAALAARRADTLLCYFGGHGVRDLAGDLCLALPGTIDRKSEARRTALPVEHLAAILNAARARTRILILDCCFAGLAMRAPSAYDLHLLTATGRTEKALSPETARTTHFGSGLIDLLRHGIPDGGESITVGDLYDWPTAGTTDTDPTPHQRTVDTSSATPLLPNPAYATARTPAGLTRRATLATRVGWRDPARAARLFAGIVRDAAEIGAPELTAFRMSEAAWVGASGDASGALDRWTALRGSDAPAADVAENIAYWQRRLG